MAPNTPQFTVLHIGDDIKYNPELYKIFSQRFKIIQPSLEERQRDNFIQALKDRKWGDFHAVFRPFWNSGGEMGRWDPGKLNLNKYHQPSSKPDLKSIGPSSPIHM